MIVLIQRVREASVTVENHLQGSIGTGLLIFLGIHRDDRRAQAEWLARKCARMRIFPDEAGNMNRSLMDTDGEALVISQFTLYGNAAKGNRPSFTRAARPEQAIPLYEHFIDQLSAELKKPVAQGVFGAMMDVSLVNDGPVTICLERKPPA